jgi:hypothetical protein
LGVARLGSHVWEKRGIWKVKEPWIDSGFVRVHVQPYSTQLAES